MELETERLILREFKENDWPDVMAYQTDPLYLRYYEWTGRTPEAVQEFVHMFLAQQQEQPRCKFQLAVTLKSTHQLIGTCGIRMASADAHEGDIGYELSPKHWGQGYATEAARAIVRFGFTELGLHRIWSWCIADNVGSARVLDKLGMRLEGRLRENEHFKGRWWDMLLFAILDYEWRAQQEVGGTTGQGERGPAIQAPPIARAAELGTCSLRTLHLGQKSDAKPPQEYGVVLEQVLGIRQHQAVLLS